MAGSLIEISSNTLGSDTSSVTLTGIDSRFDVYKFILNNVIPDTADADLQFRFTESGSPNTTSNYDRAYKKLRSDTTFSNNSATNSDKVFLTGSMENDNTTGGQNSVLYIFNANNSSEFTFATLENVFLAEDGTLLGEQGGFVLTQTTTVDGGQFFFDSGNIRSGARFVLYGLRK